MKRICIYLTYDRQKVVDKYIGYMLKELKKCVDYLAVVCNQVKIVQGRDILEKYADAIFYRENIGFDAGGFKDALCSLIGWEKVLRFDELVLVNDSMFGPFCPMESIFSEMDQKKADFWGLTIHGEGKNTVIEYIPEHIQSFFWVIRSRMLHGEQFRKYWQDMPYYNTLLDTVQMHEIRFTRYFSDMGYSFASLADTKVNDSVNTQNNYMQYAFLSYELIKKRNFPFLKRQVIANNTLEWQTQENLSRSMIFIENETDYDINLIWDNIIRTMNIADLQKSFHLQYIISSCRTKNLHRSVAILIFIQYAYSVEYVLEYVQRLSSSYSVYFFSEIEEYLNVYQEWGYECRIIKADEIVHLLSSFCEYSYVCVLHDTDMTSDEKPSCVGKSYFYNIWENLVKDERHVLEILNLFVETPYLGFLAPPQPIFAEYFGECKIGWNGKFEIIRNLLDEAEIKCQISEFKPPYRITNDFWVRGCILGKLKNIGKKVRSELQYMWSYFAQDKGYYSGIVESVEYASMNEVNLQYYINQITSQISRQYGGFNRFYEMKEELLFAALDVFCRKYPRVLVYGVGEVAKNYRKFLPNIEAYIVSDGQKKMRELDGISVKYLSEIEISEEHGIVLCLNVRNQMQVIPLLEKMGIEHFFCI